MWFARTLVFALAVSAGGYTAQAHDEGPELTMDIAREEVTRAIQLFHDAVDQVDTRELNRLAAHDQAQFDDVITAHREGDRLTPLALRALSDMDMSVEALDGIARRLLLDAVTIYNRMNDIAPAVSPRASY